MNARKKAKTLKAWRMVAQEFTGLLRTISAKQEATERLFGSRARRKPLQRAQARGKEALRRDLKGGRA